MITRIEIDGFKSFKNFAVDLNPFQVFVGPNAVGKSNLFDAIRLLADIAHADSIAEAMRANRGDVPELFRRLPDGTLAERMAFGVEMLMAPTVEDRLGNRAEVSSNRLRYELEIERFEQSGLQRLRVVREQLRALTADEDKWVRRIRTTPRKEWVRRGRRNPYISADAEGLHLHQDGQGGRKQSSSATRAERTVLSTISSASFPTAYAAQQEMRGWRFLQFDVAAMRQPSSAYDSGQQLASDGSNLAAVLFRIMHEDEDARIDISRDLANLVPGVRDVHVSALQERNELLAEVTMNDGATFSSRVLSDGTLRLLAIVALRNDPTYDGMTMLEEPENGISPAYLRSSLEALRRLSATLNPGEDDTPVEGQTPRQVLVNTHSPLVLAYVKPEELLFITNRDGEVRTTAVYPVGNEMLMPDEARSRIFAIDRVRQLLDTADIDVQVEALTKARDELVAALKGANP